MRTKKRIRTLMYGDQRLSTAELEVLHTPAMQRLYGLRQLGLTDRVFIDASHARIHHVVGVLQQVEKLVSAIISNLRRSNGDLQVSSPDGKTRSIPAQSLARYVRNRKSVIRFIGLLHDLTHAPFGHTIEDEIQLVETKHDHPKRQSEAFYRLLCQLVAWLVLEAYGPAWSGFPESLKPFLSQGAAATPPSPLIVGAALRELISGLTDSKAELCLKLTSKSIAEMFADLGYAMTALLHLEALHSKELKSEMVPDRVEHPFQVAIRTALEGTEFAALAEEFRFEPHRDAFMLDIVGNTVCADLLDYAGRDSHYAGLRLNYDPDRIAENFTLVSAEITSSGRKQINGAMGNGANGGSPEKLPNPFQGWCLRTAISLVSHKYRTDVPSELMNLLNVRFYLYERVIFHSTKCAAGSMLGTALQLVGWRELDPGNQPRLPKHLEFVGDDVFLHDILAALDFLIGAIEELPSEASIDAALVEGLSGLERVHSGLIGELLTHRVGKPVADALEELRAARLLLNRLMSRRYFRPVFRALPSTEQDILQQDAESLADLFTQPDRRYSVERDIEGKAHLPKGTITIHCPRRNTAEKIANVLLMKPTGDGTSNRVRKLNCISELDPKTFGKHQDAVIAVEEMYKSMWRLTVYVAPELMERWKEISEAAGRAIFEAVDNNHGSRFANRPDGYWPNDPELKRELEGMTGTVAAISGGVDGDLTPFGEDLGRAVDELLASGSLGPIPADFYDPEEGLTVDGRKQLERALHAALSDGKEERFEQPPKERNGRADRVLTIIRGSVKRIKKEDLEWFWQVYPTRLDSLSKEDFESVVFKFKAAIKGPEELKDRHPDFRGTWFRQCAETLDLIIGKIATSPEPKSDRLFQND